MGHSQASKTDSHERIVRIAAARFRESGIEGVGVAELMKEAGLTHGGFYRHFESRDALLAEAIDSALRHGEERVGKLMARQPEAPLAALVDGYLSPAHRDEPSAGCALVALGSEAARSSVAVRSAYTAQVERYLASLEKQLEKLGSGAAREQAIAQLATLVGALTMARAVNDEALSLEILGAAARTLKASLPPPPQAA